MDELHPSDLLPKFLSNQFRSLSVVLLTDKQTAKEASAPWWRSELQDTRTLPYVSVVLSRLSSRRITSQTRTGPEWPRHTCKFQSAAPTGSCRGRWRAFTKSIFWYDLCESETTQWRSEMTPDLADDSWTRLAGPSCQHQWWLLWVLHSSCMN